jgi:NAD+ synthase (glutamine-hydrolysing)
MDINSGVKIRLVQMEVTPANPRKNFDECKRYVDEAKRDGIQVVVFPELCISGYLIGDMWEELSFLDDCEYFGEMLAKESTT